MNILCKNQLGHASYGFHRHSASNRRHYILFLESVRKSLISWFFFPDWSFHLYANFFFFSVTLHLIHIQNRVFHDVTWVFPTIPGFFRDVIWVFLTIPGLIRDVTWVFPTNIWVFPWRHPPFICKWAQLILLILRSAARHVPSVLYTLLLISILLRIFKMVAKSLMLGLFMFIRKWARFEFRN